MKNIFLISLFVLVHVEFLNAQDVQDSTSHYFIKEKVNISGIEKGSIEKRKLLTSNGLTFSDRSAKDYKITGFKLTVVRKGKNLIELNSNSGKLNDKMIEAIKEAPIGSKLFFEYIRCIDKEGHNRTALATAFILK